MAAFLVLNDMLSASDGDTQRLEQVLDIGSYSRVTVHVRKAVDGGAGTTMQLQHSAVLDDEAFTDVSGGSFGMESTDPDNQSAELTGLLRYLRWTMEGGTATFETHAVGREY